MLLLLKFLVFFYVFYAVVVVFVYVVAVVVAVATADNATAVAGVVACLNNALMLLLLFLLFLVLLVFWCSWCRCCRCRSCCSCCRCCCCRYCRVSQTKQRCLIQKQVTARFFFRSKIKCQTIFCAKNVNHGHSASGCKLASAELIKFQQSAIKLLNHSKFDTKQGGRIAQWNAFSLHTHQPQVRFLAFPRIFSEFLMLPRLINDAAV